MIEKVSQSRTRRDLLKTTAAGVSLSLAGCLGVSGGDGDGGGGDGGPIVFGQPAALTGKWDFLQPGVSQASDLAVAEINDAGGPLGRELELTRRDTAVDPQQARTVVQQLIENDGAVTICGLYSSEIVPLYDFLTEQRVPITTPWPGTNFLDTRGGDNGTPETLSDDDWIWRTVIGDTVHTSAGAKKALDEGHDRVGVVHGTTSGARGWADGFIAAFEEGGGTVAERVEVEEGQSNYQAALSRLFDAEFDVFAVSFGQEDAITLLRDWASGGYGRQPILSDPLATSEVAEAVGEELDGAWAASPIGQGPSYDAFIERYDQAGDAQLNPWTPPAWDAIVATALAVERAGEATPEAIERNIGPVTRPGGTKVTTFEEGKQALADGDEIDFQGAATPVNYTKFGNVFGAVAVQEARGGGFEILEVIEAGELADFVEEGRY